MFHRPLLRRLIWIALISITLAVVIVLALPSIASNRLVRDRIADELGAWTGMKVELASRPEIGVWPSMRAVLHDVRFINWHDEEAPVLEARRIEMDLSAFAAMRGEVSFDKLRLIEPVLHVEPTAQGFYLPEMPRIGRIVRAIQTAREAGVGRSSAPDLSALPDDKLGVIEIVAGRVVTHEEGRVRDLATNLNGTLNWPELNHSASLRGQALWRGETVSLELESSQPLVHAAGGAATLRAALNSNLISASFSGTAGLPLRSRLTGTLQLSSSSISQASDWLRIPFNEALSPEVLEFSGQLASSADRLRFENASLIVDGHTGIGNFTLAQEADMPAISGTLAFDILDLSTMLGAFSPLLPQTEATAESGAGSLIDNMKLDLRLSASTARAGPATLSEVAATAQIRPGLAVLDISDSRVFGGTLQAGIRSTQSSSDPTTEIRFQASDFDGAAAGDALGLQALLPASAGTVSLNIKGAGLTWSDVFETADGTFSAGFARGTLRSFNLSQFLSNLENGGFFALKDVTDGTLAADGVVVKATIDDGVALFSSANVVTPERRIIIKGIVPFVGGLALTGDVLPNAPQASDPTDQTQSPPEPLATFFVGGSWWAPFISSMTMRAPLE